MAALAEAFVRIRPDTSTFKSEAEKGVASAGAGIKRAADRHGKLFGTSFVKATAGPLRGIAGVVGGPVAAAFAVIGGAKLFEGFISEGREAQKTGAQTAAVLKSTGGVAKISAAQVGDLATAISNKVGVDDEAIQSGANLLLTFTNIRNEAGKGNRIFDQATQVVTDMAAAMNQGEVTTSGLKTASIQVGKALQDPIKGVTALRKVGVSLTDQQQKQIATMVKSGNTLGAQKIILGELNKEFGGSAAAGTNAMQKLKVVFGNIQESIGTVLLPVIDKVASWLGQRLPGAVEKAQVGLSALAAAFQEGDVTSDGFVGVMERIGVAARQAFEYFKTNVLPILKQVGAFLVGTVVPALGDLVLWLARNKDVILAFGAALATVKLALFVNSVLTVVKAVRAWIVVQGGLNAVMRANVLGIIITTLALVVAGIVLAYNRSEKFRIVVQALGRGIVIAMHAAAVAFVAVFNWIRSHWPLLLGILLGPIGVAAALIIKNWDKIRAAAAALWSALKSIWSSGVRFVVGIFLGLVGAILNGAAKAFGWVPGLGGKLKAAAANFNTFRDQVNRSLEGVKSRKITVTAELSAGPGGGRNIGFAAGGPVYGPGTATSDSIHAMLSRGEHVLTAREVKGFGGHEAVARMRKIAAARAPGFAAGGPVEFDVAPQLSGLDKFRRGLEEFNRAVDAKVRKMWAESGGSGVFTPGSGNYGPANLRGNAANTQAAINFIRSRFGLTSGGWRAVGSVANSDHPRGKALDTMIPNYLSPRGIALGNAVAAYFMGNPKTFGTKYVIWRGRISEGGGWHPYFRGNRAIYGDTLAHYDHVHTSLFDRGGFLPPRSATLAVNGTNKWEPVGAAAMSGPFEITGRLRIEGDGTATLVAGKLAQVGNRGRR